MNMSGGDLASTKEQPYEKDDGSSHSMSALRYFVRV